MVTGVLVSVGVVGATGVLVAVGVLVATGVLVAVGVVVATGAMVAVGVLVATTGSSISNASSSNGGRLSLTTTLSSRLIAPAPTFFSGGAFTIVSLVSPTSTVPNLVAYENRGPVARDHHHGADEGLALKLARRNLRWGRFRHRESYGDVQ